MGNGPGAAPGGFRYRLATVILAIAFVEMSWLSVRTGGAYLGWIPANTLLHEPQTEITAAAFSPDGRMAATAAIEKLSFFEQTIRPRS